MTIPQDVQQFIGRTTLDSEGSKVGKISQVYLDEQTGRPLWVTVATGMFGTRQSFAPLYGAQVSRDEVTLAVSKEQIKDAPNVDDYHAMTRSEEQIEEPGVEGTPRDAGR